MPGVLGLLLSDPVGNFLPFIVIVLGLVVSLTIHEFAHAWVADKLGDPTPRYKNRVTLNPLAHLDPIGSLAILLVGFGWGKPVPFDPYNLKNPVADTAKIAVAGPLSNILFAILLAAFANINASVGFAPIGFVFAVTQLLIGLNVALAIFNLIPIHPLDGGKILVAFLPKVTALEYDQFMHRYGMFVLLMLVLPLAGGTSPVSQLLGPVVAFVSTLIISL